MSRVTYDMAWCAKELALKFINGTHEEAYTKLPGYCKDLANTNPHTTAIIERDDDSKFKWIFISYGASAVGFAHCLPILGLDGTHLKSKYLGILLAATGVDALGSLYPLAFAVVDAENDTNWLWFLSTLRKHVLEPHTSENLENGTFVLLSDYQKGLIDGVASIFPSLPHGYCVRHLEENFHRQFKNMELKKLLWRAAQSTEKEDFNTALQEMRGINAASTSWLLAHAPPKHWAELYFAGHHYGHLMANIAELLNSLLLHALKLPILPMFECIRYQLME
jgi:MULE transposase domain